MSHPYPRRSQSPSGPCMCVYDVVCLCVWCLCGGCGACVYAWCVAYGFCILWCVCGMLWCIYGVHMWYVRCVVCICMWYVVWHWAYMLCVVCMGCGVCGKVCGMCFLCEVFCVFYGMGCACVLCMWYVWGGNWAPFPLLRGRACSGWSPAKTKEVSKQQTPNPIVWGASHAKNPWCWDSTWANRCSGGVGRQASGTCSLEPWARAHWLRTIPFGMRRTLCSATPDGTRYLVKHSALATTTATQVAAGIRPHPGWTSAPPHLQAPCLATQCWSPKTPGPDSSPQCSKLVQILSLIAQGG